MDLVYCVMYRVVVDSRLLMICKTLDRAEEKAAELRKDGLNAYVETRAVH